MVTFYRRLPKFDYLNPLNIEEALTLLARYRKKAMLVAGGTDLIPKLKRRLIPIPKYIINLKSLPGLDYIKYEKGNGLEIGPLVTIDDIEKSGIIKEKFNILFQAAESMASPQVRNRGTITGNICNAAPSAETAPAILVMNAEIQLANIKGNRDVSTGDFFKGPGKTVLKADEMLIEIKIPELPAGSTGKYIKLSPRRTMDLATVGVAVLIVPDGDRCGDIRIALGAVSPTPVRATVAEELLRGRKLDTLLVEQAAVAAAACCRPISDHRASAEYRTEMVRVLTGRAIRDLWKMC